VTVTSVRIGSADDYLLLTPDESDPVIHSYSAGFADLAAFFVRNWSRTGAAGTTPDPGDPSKATSRFRRGTSIGTFNFV
jgi:hypothetical protein